MLELTLQIWGFCLLLLVTAMQTARAQQPELQRIYQQIDHAAANFHTAQANFLWDQYEKVVNDHDLQKGTVYFRRTGSELQMAADISEPKPPKNVLYTGNEVEVYQPSIDRLTKYNAGKDKAAFESLLVLGFGGSAQDMQKNFDVSYAGTEKLGSLETVKLNLVPKSDKVRNVFNLITLWIDPSQGISVKQQFFAPSGDYRLANYSDIRLNQKIPDSTFKLKTTNKTTVMSPQG
jgi:outer membrane lipoprotein-sorting protein